MDVWSITDPEEIRRAIESLLLGGSFQYNSNWIYRSDRDFLNPYGDAYYPGLNYNSRTGQLWFLSGGMASDSYVSQLTRISKGMWGNSYAGYGSLDEFVGNDMWQRISDDLNGASFVIGGTAYSGGRALDRTMTYYISSFSQARPAQVMFKLPGYNMLGQLAYVLPPLASDNLPVSGAAYSGSNDYRPLI